METRNADRERYYLWHGQSSAVSTPEAALFGAEIANGDDGGNAMR
jgi:hypothetical protein